MGPVAQATEDTLTTIRKFVMLSSLALGLVSLLGVIADALQVFDSLNDTGHRAVSMTVGFVLILAPVVASAIYFIPQNRAIFLFCLTGIVLAATGAFSLGGGIDARRTSSSAPRATGEGQGTCRIKSFTPDPGRLHDCARLELLNSQAVDVDEDHTGTWIKPADEADIRFSRGSIAPAHKGVSLTVISTTYTEQNLPQLSYLGCKAAKQSATPIAVKDMAADMAICVSTDEWRVAVLQIVDVAPKKQSLLVKVTCWQLR